MTYTFGEDTHQYEERPEEKEFKQGYRRSESEKKNETVKSYPCNHKIHVPGKGFKDCPGTMYKKGSIYQCDTVPSHRSRA